MNGGGRWLNNGLPLLFFSGVRFSPFPVIIRKPQCTVGWYMRLIPEGTLLFALLNFSTL